MRVIKDMKVLPDDISRFFHKASFVVVSTVGKNKMPHNSCKGIVKIDKKGRVYLLDLYRMRTFANLKQNPHISITAVDERSFKGWCLKGKAKIAGKQKLKQDVMKAWEERIAARITQRVIKNMTEEKKGHGRHPEAQLPGPEYMIVMDVEEIVDLMPHHMK